MPSKYKITAVNGSPHEGFGNTAMLVAMLREHLTQDDMDVEEILINQRQIRHCAGCAVCIEKGSCWIKDDYKQIAQNVLEADAVILASPVYFLNVTAQMKTFIDRSLGFGHRPRGTWKPGLAVSVSAGMGETWVSDYLASLLRVFGAYPVGRLTAIGIGPGGFLGKELVEERAKDLARDLARAIREKRRFPATDQDLRYWHFMAHLVRENRDFMRADHEHWEKHGFYESFEEYVGQRITPTDRDPEMRKEWIRDLIRRQSESTSHDGAPGSSDSAKPGTARELLEHMPRALNREAAKGMRAVYQFEVSGGEQFDAYIEIDDGSARFSEGRIGGAQVTIRTPAEVWLAIARGELDGASAFMSGKYTAEGDLTLLMKLKSLFGTGSSR